MDNLCRDDLLKIARRLSDDADNVRRVIQETGSRQPLLESALTDLVHAEGLILDAAHN